MKKGLSLVLGLGMLAGAVNVPANVYAEPNPTTCEGIENCEVVASAEELANFFPAGEGKFVSREGEATLIVGGDFALDRDYYISDSNVSLYLGDYTITANEYSFLLYDTTLNIYGGEHGMLSNAGEDMYYAPLYVREGAVVNMYGGTIWGGEYDDGTYEPESTVILDDGGKMNLYDGEIYGKTWVVSLFNDTEFTMTGGSLTTTGPDSIAVSGNGTVDPSKDNYGANAKVTITGGTINSNDLGVYAPQVGGLTTIGGTAVINAVKAGVEIRAGELVVEGGTINVEPETEYAFNPNGSGSTATGVGIAVAQHTTKQAIKATIRGGTFTAPVAFAEGNPQHNAEEDVEKVEVAILGGRFVATNGDPVVASEDLTGFVGGGEFSKAPEEAYVAEGKEVYRLVEDGIWVVSEPIEEKLEEIELVAEEGETDDEELLAFVKEQLEDVLVAGEVDEDGWVDNGKISLHYETLLKAILNGEKLVETVSLIKNIRKK